MHPITGALVYGRTFKASFQYELGLAGIGLRSPTAPVTFPLYYDPFAVLLKIGLSFHIFSPLPLRRHSVGVAFDVTRICDLRSNVEIFGGEIAFL